MKTFQPLNFLTAQRREGVKFTTILFCNKYQIFYNLWLLCEFGFGLIGSRHSLRWFMVFTFSTHWLCHFYRFSRNRHGRGWLDFAMKEPCIVVYGRRKRNTYWKKNSPGTKKFNRIQLEQWDWAATAEKNLLIKQKENGKREGLSFCHFCSRHFLVAEFIRISWDF